MKRTIILTIVIVLSLLISYGFFYHTRSEEIQGNLSKWASTIIQIVFILTIISVIYAVIRENNNPIATIAWIQVLVFLPIAGFILYLIFGLNPRKTKIFAQKALHDQEKFTKFSSKFKIKDLQNQSGFSRKYYNKINHLIKLLYQNNKSHLTAFNEIKVFKNGKTKIDALLNDIENAKNHIHLEYFSIADDQTGQLLRKTLIKKANMGIKIRIIYDAVGSWRLGKKYYKPLIDAGIELAPFLPVKLPWLSSKINYRNHRKIAVIDGKTAYIGGVNIGDKYYGLTEYYGYWRDTHIRIKGDAVKSLQKIFTLDWLFTKKQDINDKELFPETNINNLLPTQVISSGPDSNWESIMQAHFAAISKAEKYVYIATPYLVLTESLLTALKTTALSSVEIKIILPSFPDHRIVFYGSRSYYEELLEAGVKIYEYTKGFMHSKVILVDGNFVSIGTANMDIRSYKQNLEVNTVIYDCNFTNLIKTQFTEDFFQSKEINLSEFKKRKIYFKSVESFCRLFSPLL